MFSEFNDNVITVNGFEPVHLLCKRPDAATASARHVKDRIFKLIPIHASVICLIHCFIWFQLQHSY